MNKKTILVVDDTPDNLSVLYEILKNDYRVLVANGGEKALQIIRGGASIDLVLLDILMPDIDGYQVCSRIRLDKSTKNLPVVFSSAIDEDEQKQKAEGLNVSGYICKPYRKDKVLDEIARILSV
ncbi:MAG: response regulator [Spirochaetes bacterium]|nr:response regulator [Spirochaetota bacterium]MBN2770100.1 response regulator [Spirochaetota bacterium]